MLFTRQNQDQKSRTRLLFGRIQLRFEKKKKRLLFGSLVDLLGLCLVFIPHSLPDLSHLFFCDYSLWLPLLLCTLAHGHKPGSYVT